MWQPGDWGMQSRGLEGLFMPRDMVYWDVLRASMRAGVVASVPGSARVAYGLLWARAEASGRIIGVRDESRVIPEYHPLLYLWSCIYLVGGYGKGYFPPAVESAYQELCNER